MLKYCQLQISIQNTTYSVSLEYILHLLRVNALNCISHYNMLWTPFLGNQCYGLHILSVSVDSISHE